MNGDPASRDPRPGRASRRASIGRVSFLAVLILFAPRAALAQTPDTTGWDSPRARLLMQRARDRRHQPLADTALHDYQSHAEGVVYFYLDRRDTDERVLIRTDQVALEVYWAQPNRTKQRIVGMRDENSLPNRMYYHLDHLTVVQNGFGDIMRMGDGDEVADVPHPAAPGSDSVYEFRLADSLEIRLPGARAPIKTYEIQVRPRRFDRSAIIGSVFVDQQTADIVRMTFTFTPVSYVDRRLEHINISLDNWLWEGRYWLPYEQAVEIRRQVPELDFVVTSVIQARFRVWDYRFNQDLPPSLFMGYRVVAAPKAEREAYPFDRGIYEDLHDAGLAPPPSLADIRAEASALVRDRVLSGLPRLRLSLPAASSALRYNRSEGAFLGWGGSFTPNDRTRLEISGGYAFGAEQPVVIGGVRFGAGAGSRLRIDGYLNEPRDMGVRAGAPGALNTLTSLWGSDYSDLFYASGVRASIARHLDERTWLVTAAGAAERQAAARLTRRTPPLGESEFRPVLMADEGTALLGRLSLERLLPESAGFSWGMRLSLDAGAFEGDGFAVPRSDLSVRHGSYDRSGVANLMVAGGVALGAAPAQRTFLLGGRETLPGHPYRNYAGDRFVLVNLEGARDIRRPFVRARMFAAGGWTHGPGPSFRMQPGGTSFGALPNADPVRGSVGAGVGLLWDLLHVDMARGLGSGGEWQLLVSIDPQVWPIL
jgi:hypothetical protein